MQPHETFYFPTSLWIEEQLEARRLPAWARREGLERCERPLPWGTERSDGLV